MLLAKPCDNSRRHSSLRRVLLLRSTVLRCMPLLAVKESCSWKHYPERARSQYALPHSFASSSVDCSSTTHHPRLRRCPQGHEARVLVPDRGRHRDGGLVPDPRGGDL